MTLTKIKLRPSTIKDCPGRVLYIVTRNNTSHVITTEHKLFPYEWDEERSAVILSTDERLQAIDRQIRYDIRRLERIIRNFDEVKLDYSAEDVVTEYKRIGEDKSLFLFLEGLILRHKQLNHKGTAKTYRATLESFRQFRLDEEVSIEDIDISLIEEYEAWLRAKGLTPNTISFYMKILRATYNKAVHQGLTTDCKPFRTMNIRMEKTRKRAISIKEIKRINNLKLSSQPRLEFARDIFLFLFYCRGMSFVDAAYLRKSNITNGGLTYRRQKTNQLLHIKLEPKMQNIINRYSKLDSLYLLPLIYPFGDDRKQYEAALHRINRSLKKIGKMANINIPLTTYVCRHSWATIAKKNNIALSVISEALGHDSEITTQIYLSSVDPATIDKANSLIISSL